MEENLQLCDRNQWCTFESVDNLSIKIQMSFLILMLLLTILIIVYLVKLYKFRVDDQYIHLFGKVFVRVYQIVVAWLCCTLIKLVINIAAYDQFIGQDYNDFQPPSNHSPIVILSSVFICFDQCSTFFVVYLIILIPYQWFNYFMEHLNDINLQIPFQSRKLFWVSFKVLRIVKTYIILRFILIIGYITQAVLIVQTNYACNIPSLQVGIVIGQSILTFFFYIFAFYVAEHTRKQKLITMQKQDYKKIRIQYALLMFALLVRILLNIFFNGFVSSMIDYHPEVNCFDSNQDNNFKRSMFLVLGFAIMHLLPIGIILYIYRPSLEERQSFQNLLRYSQNLINPHNDSVILTNGDSHDNIDVNLTQRLGEGQSQTVSRKAST